MEKHEIVYIPIDELYSHPQNPRKDLGDLTELTESIRLNGVMQNLTVVPGHVMPNDMWLELSREYLKNPTEEMRTVINERWCDDGYTVVIGHRRCAAARAAGLTELPCVIADMDEKTQLETMLTENMQRADLTIWEQAQGFQLMLDLGSTETQIAEKTGFSKKTVRNRVKIAALGIDKEEFEEAEGRGGTIEDFAKLAEVHDTAKRDELVKYIGTRDFGFMLGRVLREQKQELVLARILPIIQSFATKIEPHQRWATKYHRVESYDLNNDDVEVSVPAEDDKRTFVYCKLSDSVDVYYEQEEVEDPLDEERRRRDQDLMERRERIDHALAAAAESRFKYMSEIETHISRPISSHLGFDLAAAFEGPGIFMSLSRDTIIETLKTHSIEMSCLIFLHSLLSPEVYASHTYEWGSVKFKPNENLNRIYDFVTHLGYVKSETEEQLLNGTFEAYVQEDAERGRSYSGPVSPG